MSSESTTRLKRGSTSNPAPDGDHRKRRRNRTTQSCLNCHTSKRMCDRKRPACARCTQLGLTGLCVYEVDDPSQRPESQDESARLLKRVAELEGVIRELKNKPHPRWSQTGSSPGREFDKWHPRPPTGQENDMQEVISSNVPSPASPSGLSEKEGAPAKITKPPITTGHRPTSSLSFCYNSPQSTPSPSLMTPTEEYAQTHTAITGHPDISDYDLAAMFFTYPGLAGYEESSSGLLKANHADESCFLKQHGGHCGCLHEPTNYNVVLELSIRLRKAADILARSASHHMGSNCLLNQRISDLDTFATNALGNIMSPLEDVSLLAQDRSRPNNATSQQAHLHGPSPRRPPISTNFLRPWDWIPTTPASPLISCDDSFMSWEPPRRT